MTLPPCERQNRCFDHLGVQVLCRFCAQASQFSLLEHALEDIVRCRCFWLLRGVYNLKALASLCLYLGSGSNIWRLDRIKRIELESRIEYYCTLIDVLAERLRLVLLELLDDTIQG